MLRAVRHKTLANMDMMSLPFVSVILPVYNDAERLKICLGALEEQTYPKEAYEVIVVDNNSAESIEAIVENYAQARADFEDRPGSYSARNKGLATAQGEVLAFTDSDCIPAADWIERGVKALLSVPNCGIVGGEVTLFFKDPDRPTAVELYDRLMYLSQKRYVEKYKYSATANLFTFRHVFERVGDFDGTLQSGGDKEWGQRVTAAGYTLFYAADVRIKHPARATLAEMQEKTRRVARGFTKRAWKQHLAPLSWTYESLMDHLPPIPPVVTTMRISDATFGMKMKILMIWCLLRYTRIVEILRTKCVKATRQ
ncbi:glycosyl transferase family 2 [candidate division KSB3 bacterium]|uniref:Glycosyl transferase family 2 n=1 Tax=candidate division KSB3 bacterium TaxID=2044937 RepID=A0A2G6E878_9BACT|nr:MAG: glycosyl transferase family 2 [candidate division KSB3 bacterium]PIE30614.1 MAG: glycosyl transferase family 2 [candidate division KSB3 bacterium]